MFKNYLSRCMKYVNSKLYIFGLITVKYFFKYQSNPLFYYTQNETRNYHVRAVSTLVFTVCNLNRFFHILKMQEGVGHTQMIHETAASKERKNPVVTNTYN